MSSEITQNPSITLSNISPKGNKQQQQLVAKNKSSNKRSPKLKTFKNSSTNNNYSKPLKVVYISNPIKYQVNNGGDSGGKEDVDADEFQALVQGLTGQDAVELNNDSNNNNNNYSNRDLTPTNDGGIIMHHDEVIDDVEQEPLIDDDQVNMDGYENGPSQNSSIDYYGPLDVFGAENKGDYGELFPSLYD